MPPTKSHVSPRYGSGILAEDGRAEAARGNLRLARDRGLGERSRLPGLLAELEEILAAHESRRWIAGVEPVDRVLHAGGAAVDLRRQRDRDDGIGAGQPRGVPHGQIQARPHELIEAPEVFAARRLLE